MHKPDDDNFSYYSIPPDFAQKQLTYVPPRTKEEFIQWTRERGISHRVQEAFSQIDRNLFIPEPYPEIATYISKALPIKMERGDTMSSISQPETVAVMTDLLDIQPGQSILEIGSGGYQSAICSWLVGDRGMVTTIDIDEEIAHFAEQNIWQLGLENVNVIVGDGSRGYESFAPYDRVLVTASIPPFPLDKSPLFQQLQPGGVLVGPFGGFGNMKYGFGLPYRGFMLSIGKSEEGEAYFIRPPSYEDLYQFVEMQGSFGWNAFKKMYGRNRDKLFIEAVDFVENLGWSEYVEHLVTTGIIAYVDEDEG